MKRKSPKQLQGAFKYFIKKKTDLLFIIYKFIYLIARFCKANELSWMASFPLSQYRTLVLFFRATRKLSPLI